MRFDPYKITRMDLDGDILVDDPTGNYTYSDDFYEMRDWWEARGDEIERLEKIIKGVSELCDSL